MGVRERYHDHLLQSGSQPSQPTFFPEGGKVDARRRIPAVAAVARAELLGDFLVAVGDPERRLPAGIRRGDAGGRIGRGADDLSDRKSVV
jgi:hypothetical protein